jgi:hypothetical protein
MALYHLYGILSPSMAVSSTTLCLICKTWFFFSLFCEMMLLSCFAKHILPKPSIRVSLFREIANRFFETFHETVLSKTLAAPEVLHITAHNQVYLQD